MTQPSVGLTKVNESGRKPDGAGGYGVGAGAEVETGDVLVESLADGEADGVGCENGFAVHDARVIASSAMPTSLERSVTASSAAN